MTWTTDKPTQTGWYWYRKDPADVPILLYCGAVWDHLVDFAGLNEQVAFMKDHLLEGEWAAQHGSEAPMADTAGEQIVIDGAITKEDLDRFMASHSEPPA
jgi:hypothetical protein